MPKRPLHQDQMPLVAALKRIVSDDHAAFYTPGHKRGQGSPAPLADLLGKTVFQADIPELPELDNLFAPQGVIADAQDLAAQAFGAERTWFLINGSTSGVIAAIVATCAPGEKIILPRNAHQSAISGLILSGAVPIFIAPEYDPDWDLVHSITPQAVAAALAEHPDSRAVLMVYPTYEGICGDVATIATLAHNHGIPLLVDEAHGAHLHFHPELPPSALSLGADLSVQSIHKVLSSFTQSAMVHTRGDRVSAARLSQTLALVQSTSPSNLLLASLDAARQQMALHGHDLMGKALQLAALARLELAQIPGIAPFSLHHPSPGCLTIDPTRLTVRVVDLNMTGFEADGILHHQLGVICELPALQHLTFIISLGNTDQDIHHLVAAFKQMSENKGQQAKEERQSTEGRKLITLNLQPSTLNPVLPRDAFFTPKETVSVDRAVDRLSGELICPYPPGIPALIPGERITAAVLAYLQQVLKAGGYITGCADPSLQTIVVLH